MAGAIGERSDAVLRTAIAPAMVRVE